jgi:hypothetical protein
MDGPRKHSAHQEVTGTEEVTVTNADRRGSPGVPPEMAQC